MVMFNIFCLDDQASSKKTNLQIQIKSGKSCLNLKKTSQTFILRNVLIKIQVGNALI